MPSTVVLTGQAVNGEGSRAGTDPGRGCPFNSGRANMRLNRTIAAGSVLLAMLGAAPTVTPAARAFPLSHRATAQVGAYGPQDLRAAYDVPASRTRATVAVVVAYDAPSIATDMATYRAAFGLSACTGTCFRKVNQAGEPAPLPAVNSAWAAEATLDVDMVSAICPTCRILLVEADDDDRTGQPNLPDSIATATRLGARYVSMSWGIPETPDELRYDSTDLGGPDVTYVAAAGDGGYRTGWPAASPLAVSVGGTTLRRAPRTARGWSETAWSASPTLGTGSGCSSYEPRPAWQNPAVTGCQTRALNDVAVDASESPGVYVSLGGRWFTMGGTSAAAPIVAAMAAVAGVHGNPMRYAYAHTDRFHDVRHGVTGSCGSALCQARAGWDGPTGIGSPDGTSGI